MDEQPWVNPFATFVDAEGGSVTIQGFRRARGVEQALRMLAGGMVGVRRCGWNLR